VTSIINHSTVAEMKLLHKQLTESDYVHKGQLHEGRSRRHSWEQGQGLGWGGASRRQKRRDPDAEGVGIGVQLTLIGSPLRAFQ